MRPIITAAYVFTVWVVLVLVVLGLDTLVAYIGFLWRARAWVTTVWAIGGTTLTMFAGAGLIIYLEYRWPARQGVVFGVCGLLATFLAIFYLAQLGEVLELRPLVEHGVRIDAVVVEEHEFSTQETLPIYSYTIRRLDGTEIPGELNPDGRLEVGEQVSVVVDPENRTLPRTDPEGMLVEARWTTRVSGAVTAVLLVVAAWGAPRPKRLMRSRSA
ncbi:hypothetical protein [Dactylosporangium sp. CA-092794]|uniref:hypothetical protein n=1 Tax=Dactylosporangium sp. CA-092794 TaxID=3239929 RepID=UPI003D927D2C